MTKKARRVPDPQNYDQPESARPEVDAPLNEALAADVATDSEAGIGTDSADAVIVAEAEAAAAASDTFEQASDGLSGTESENPEGEEEPAPEPPAELKRLQKILAQSGIASRRHAEELITQGRVQVNGKVVTELGSKADAHRDHIRVDGKLIHGSERQRYFMLNKPKGYVTTVSDPEGRPTIMEFFSKTRERLYPVGRLDYLSEGLLLVTNDGELANKLTRAASGVEKTYLVKVSGQPTEEALDRLREGVAIAKGALASGRVQTAPAQIQPFRPGKPGGKRGPSRPVDNPWYEVVLIEGRNRELRKMFEEIGHHVEKIRRVGYGPLVLDIEPGKIRELSPEEVEDLRKAAEGKYRKPKPRVPRKREFGQRSEREAFKPRSTDRPRENIGTRPSSPGEGDRRPFRRDQPSFGQRPEFGGRARPERTQFRRDSISEPRREFRPGTRPAPRFSEDRPQRPPYRDQSGRVPFRGKPADRNRSAESGSFQREDRSKRFGSRPPRREFGGPARSEGGPPEGRRQFESRPQQRPAEGRPFRRDSSAGRPTSRRDSSAVRPASREDQPRFDRPRSAERGRPERRDDHPPRRDRPAGRQTQPRLDIRPVEDHATDRRDENRPPYRDRPDARPRFDRPRRENAGSERSEGRSGRPERRPDQRSSSPRPAGKFKGGGFKGGRRNAPGGKPGSTRSSGGRRPNSRPGESRPKRRP